MNTQTQPLVNQPCFSSEDFLTENPLFLSEQLITYIGNKRSLLRFIRHAVHEVKKRLNKNALATFDVFSGSGIVSRYLKQHSDTLFTNDLEKYAGVINKCYLANKNDVDLEKLTGYHTYLIEELTKKPLNSGFISELYAPQNDSNIQPNERAFYTKRNAQYIDTARQLIEDIPQEYQHFFIAPLLSEASVHANTSGVFKGFYKCKNTGRGQFGGSNRDALQRIGGDIHLPLPVFSNYKCLTHILRGDSNKIVDTVPEVDLAYIDPPYNQHPYGSNYFMLNLIVDYVRPKEMSVVSGIPTNWNRSSYNKKTESCVVFMDLLKKLRAKFILISFNSEGFISLEKMLSLLKDIGSVSLFETKYNTFRGSRNLNNRDIHIKEYLYLVEKY